MWPNKETPFYFHFHGSEYPKSATICFLPKAKGNSIFYFGCAICNDKDTFSRKLGRRISSGRAKKDMTVHNQVEANNLGELREKANMFYEQALGRIHA